MQPDELDATPTSAADQKPVTEPDGYYGEAEYDTDVDLSFLDDDKA